MHGLQKKKQTSTGLGKKQSITKKFKAPLARCATKNSKLQVSQSKFYRNIELICNKMISLPEPFVFKHHKANLFQENPNLYDAENFI